MNGLINSAMEEQEQPMPETEEQSVEAEGGGTEDENIERVSIAAQNVLYDDQTHPGIMKMLQAGADDPANTLARVTATIITQLDDTAGGNIPEEAILPAAVEVITLVAELAETAKVFAADEQVQTEAVSALFPILGEHYGWSDEDMQELQQILAEEQGQPEGAQPMEAANDQPA